MKVLFYANTDWYLFNFRLALLKAIRELGHEVVLVAPPGNYGPKLEAEGFRWRPLPLNRRSLNPLLELWHIGGLSRILKQEQPDLVHNFTIKCVVYGSIAARFAGCAGVVNALAGLGHVFSQRGRKAWLLRQAVQGLIRISCAPPNCRVIVQNEGDFHTLIDTRLVRQGQVFLIRGSGVDTRRFSPAPKNESDGLPMVLFASRLLKAKGIVEFVNAAKTVKEKGIACRFVVAGAPDPGNPGAVSERELSAWKDWNCVEFVGQRDDIHNFVRDASIVVLVSTYGEGVPRILLEGAACGVPLIASDQAGCREIVNHKLNGLVVPAGDESALVSAIEYLLENPDERRRMGINGRKKAAAEFAVEMVIDRTLEVYRELVPGI